MIAIWIILGLLLLVLFGLLFSPITLLVDTDRKIYRLKITGLGNAEIVPVWETDDLIMIKIRLWFWKWEISVANSLLNPKPSKKTESPKPKKKKKRKKKSWMSFSRIKPKIRRILRSFRIHHFELNLDTHDPVWNAWLYPVAYLMQRRGYGFSINFVRYNALRLKLSNRLFNILWAIAR